MNISWTPTALSDLESLHGFIGEDDPPAAADDVEAILAGIQMLRLHPDLGRKGRVSGTRELVVKPYVSAYRLRKSSVEVLAVIHGTRRWPDCF